MNKVVFTCNDRPHFLQETLNSWKSVRGLDRWDFHIFIEPSELRTQVLDVVDKSGINFTTHLNESKNGVLHNPWVALDYSFSQGADFTILGEDDLVVSSDILEYFEYCSQEFSPEANLGVCAYNGGVGLDDSAVMQHKGFAVWLWGTWKEPWYTHLRDTWDHNYSTFNGYPGNQSGWDWNINRIVSRTQLPFVHPEVSRSKHIGRSGVHMTPAMFDQIECPTYVPHRGSVNFHVRQH